MSWTPWHDRLHRRLLQQPDLLPSGSRLLLAVSGGQDSMALCGLLPDMVPLHQWDLALWHGDHGWHPDSGRFAAELSDWARGQELAIRIERAMTGAVASEAAARRWRYACLMEQASAEQRDVVTGHTATDRAETLLLQMARGTDLAGLGSLRPLRPLAADVPEGPWLRRPLLSFSRGDTAAICRDLRLPLWIDPSNDDPAYARNRIRLELLPVLDALHPGAERRMADLAERLSQVQDTRQELSELALQHLRQNDGLDRRGLGRLSGSSRRQLLAFWLEQQGVIGCDAALLEELSRRLALGAAGGSCDLPGGWRLSWQGKDLLLLPPAAER